MLNAPKNFGIYFKSTPLCFACVNICSNLVSIFILKWIRCSSIMFWKIWILWEFHFEYIHFISIKTSMDHFSFKWLENQRRWSSALSLRDWIFWKCPLEELNVCVELCVDICYMISACFCAHIAWFEFLTVFPLRFVCVCWLMCRHL